MYHKILPVLLLIMSYLSIVPTAYAVEHHGRYVGFGAADGQKLTIEQHNDGLHIDHSLVKSPFKAETQGDWLQGVAQTQEGQFLYRIRVQGAMLGLIRAPIKDTLKDEDQELLYFVREGTELPQLPEGFIEAPIHTTRQIDAIAFLKSYPFWSPEGVSDGYILIPDTFKAVIQLHPYVHADIAWKACQASMDQRRRAVPLLLQAQNITCTALVDTMSQLQNQQKFTAFKNVVATQSRHAQQAIACARGEKMTEVCEEVSKKTSEYALNIQTIQAVLLEVAAH